MSVQQADMDELRRIYTNTYNSDKRFIQRVLQGISALNKKVSSLEAENKALKAQLAEK